MLISTTLINTVPKRTRLEAPPERIVRIGCGELMMAVTVPFPLPPSRSICMLVSFASKAVAVASLGVLMLSFPSVLPAGPYVLYICLQSKESTTPRAAPPQPQLESVCITVIIITTSAGAIYQTHTEELIALP